MEDWLRKSICITFVHFIKLKNKNQVPLIKVLLALVKLQDAENKRFTQIQRGLFNDQGGIGDSKFCCIFSKWPFNLWISIFKMKIHSHKHDQSETNYKK